MVVEIDLETSPSRLLTKGLYSDFFDRTEPKKGDNMRKREYWKSMNEKFRSFRGIESTGFIKRFTDDAANRSKCQPDVAEACALVLLSTVCHLFTLYDKKGALKMNLWMLIIGDSGSGKSIPIGYVEKTLRELEKRFQDTDQNNCLKFLGPTDFSPEGLTRYLCMKVKDTNEILHRVMVIIKQEAAELVKNMSKSYQANSFEFYCLLHDGARIFRRLVDREDEVEGQYVTFLGATTDSIYPYMEREFFLQGTGNRMLPVIIEAQKNQEETTYDEFFGGGQQQSFNPSNYLTDLHRVILLGDMEIAPTREAGEMWLDYEWAKLEERERIKGENHGDLDAIFLLRMPPVALKLAALSSISRNIRGMKQGEVIQIEVDDMKWAIGKTEHIIEYHHKMVVNWSLTLMDRQVEYTRSMLNKLRRAYEGAPDGFLTRDEIHCRTGLPMNRSFYEMLETAQAAGIIEVIEPEILAQMAPEVKDRHGIKSAGRRPTGYKLLNRGESTPTTIN